ncbi:MAG: DMT family transporter [Deferribacterales bacterium]
METRSKGISYVLAGVLLMSLDAVFVRLSGLPGWNASFLFGLFSFIAMCLFTQFFQEGVVTAIRNGGAVIILSGMIMGGSGNTFVLAVKETAVANVVLIMSSTPLFSALFSRIFLKEKTGAKTWIATAVTLAGIFIIVKGSLTSEGIKGDLLAVAATAFASFNYVLWRKYPKISRSMAVGMGGFFIALFSSFGMQASSFNLYGVAVMAVMGLLTAPFGRTFVSTSARYIMATEISLYSLLRTVITPVIIWAVFREMPPSATFFGGSLMMASVLWYIMSKK